MSSTPWFQQWSDRAPDEERLAAARARWWPSGSPISAPRTWLAEKGWLRAGRPARVRRNAEEAAGGKAVARPHGRRPAGRNEGGARPEKYLQRRALIWPRAAVTRSARVAGQPDRHDGHSRAGDSSSELQRSRKCNPRVDCVGAYATKTARRSTAAAGRAPDENTWPCSSQPMLSARVSAVLLRETASGPRTTRRWTKESAAVWLSQSRCTSDALECSCVAREKSAGQNRANLLTRPTSVLGSLTAS
jgi:hypothetical protein